MTEHDLTESQLVGSRIRDARINRRMSQADLAAKANISLPHVSNIEKGKTSMKLETFIRIIEALQVSADSLLRPDVPEVRSLYQSEFDELLADCSPKELDSILKIVRELKSTMARRDDNTCKIASWNCRLASFFLIYRPEVKVLTSGRFCY